MFALNPPISLALVVDPDLMDVLWECLVLTLKPSLISKINHTPWLIYVDNPSNVGLVILATEAFKKHLNNICIHILLREKYFKYFVFIFKTL